MVKNIFYGYHPLVNLVYFASVILFSVFFMHPVFLLLALSGSVAYAAILLGRNIRSVLLFALPMFLMICIINPLFNHKGMTVLFYMKDNPVTMEAVVYGIASAGMLLSVLLWFACYNQVVSSDKLIYLFGKAIPHIALLLTMALRFIPRFTRQAKRIAGAQKLMGKGTSGRKWGSKLKNGIRIVSILVTWALENSIETADSMKARGYGLKGRTAFSLFRFEKRDGALLCILCGCIAGILILSGMGYSYHQYYPYIDYAEGSFPFLLMAVLYGLLCFIPTALEITEALKWRVLQSRI